MNSLADIDQLLDRLASKGIRLWTEDGRLKYEGPKGSLDATTREDVSRHRQQLMLKLTPPTVSDRFLLEDMQQAYWVGQNAGLELSTAAAYYMELDITGISAKNLAAALDRVVARHELLRAVILPTGEQKILREVPACSVPVHDLTKIDPVALDAHLGAVRNRLCTWEIDTGSWPQFRLEASVIGERFRLHLRFALWIMDGWSLSVFFDEVLALATNPETVLPPVGMPFASFVAARQEARRSRRYERALAYWRNRLASLPAAPSFPLMTTANNVNVSRFRHLTRRLTPEVWTKFSRRAGEIGVTPSMALCAVYSEVLGRFCGADSITLTVLHSNRTGYLPDAARSIGNFGTTVLLQADFVAGENFSQRAKRLQGQLWTDLEHGLVSGVDVVRELNAVRGSHGASFPVTFTIVPAIISGELTAKAALVHHAAHLQVPQVVLDHQLFEEVDGGAVLNFDYVEQLFFPDFIEQLFNTYLGQIEHLVAEKGVWQAAALPLIREHILPDVPRDCAEMDGALLHDLFVKQAMLQPDRIALLADLRSFTYGELHRRALAVATELRTLSVRPNELVAITMEKGWEQVVAGLGILIAGGAYVPIDAELPEQRRHLLYQEAEVRVVLTQSWLAHTLDWPDNLVRIAVDELAPAEVAELLPNVQTPLDLAYVIFTSGSTGKPKGVMIDHRGAVNTIADLNDRLAIGPNDRILAISSLSFDLSVYDIFGLLGAGGAVVIPEAAFAKDPFHWCELIELHGITVWNSVPALMQLMIEHATARSLTPSSLRVVMMSGDWIPLALPQQIASLLPDTRIISLGGATEASIWSILYPIERMDPSWRSVPYGRAMKNQSVHVLDQALNECPVWAIGPLYIGGVGLAKGYWRDGEKTTAAFITHPVTGDRLYKTGDLGRYLPSGDIEFLGREDFQVKIQGYRIECAEVEAALVDCQGVKSAAVRAIVDKSGARRLVGYVVGSPNMEIPSAAQLQNALQARLPAYMVPSAIVTIPTMPLSSNGKVDRNALPSPELGLAEGNRRFVAPRNEIEFRLADIWQDLLGRDKVSVADNFFDLGGTSFTAMRLMARIQEATGKTLQIGTLIHSPTVEALASVLADTVTKVGSDSHLVAISAAGRRRPLFLVHPVGGNVLCYVELARELGTDQPVYGLQAPGLVQGEGVLASVEELAELYIAAIRKLQRHGPYYLGGWSFGGIVAYEMARRLSDSGEKVASVVMIDSHLIHPDMREPTSEATLLAAFAKDISVISGSPIDPASLAGSPQMTSAFEVFKANSVALRRWQPSHFSGRVLLISARTGGGPSLSAEVWGQAAPLLEVAEVDGDHYSIMSGNGLEQVVALIHPLMIDGKEVT